MSKIPTGRHWRKAFQMETGSSKGSEASLVCRKSGCTEGGHLGSDTGKVKLKSKCEEFCTERVQLSFRGHGVSLPPPWVSSLQLCN